jgi:hypothetical protein
MGGEDKGRPRLCLELPWKQCCTGGSLRPWPQDRLPKTDTHPRVLITVTTSAHLQVSGAFREDPRMSLEHTERWLMFTGSPTHSQTTPQRTWTFDTIPRWPVLGAVGPSGGHLTVTETACTKYRWFYPGLGP